MARKQTFDVENGKDYPTEINANNLSNDELKNKFHLRLPFGRKKKAKVFWILYINFQRLYSTV